jgi:hypothetical protein
MIRELRYGDVEEFVKLRREALLDSPLAFASSPGTTSSPLQSQFGRSFGVRRSLSSSLRFGRIWLGPWASIATDT